MELTMTMQQIDFEKTLYAKDIGLERVVGINEISREIIFKFTPTLAKDCLKYNYLPAQRLLDKKRVRKLYRAMKRGLFHGASICLAKDISTGATYLTNGQHVCNAVLIYDKAIAITMHHFECADIEKISYHYRQWDKPDNVRRTGEILNVEARVHGKEWPKFLPPLIASAAGIATGDFTWRPDRDTKAIALNLWWDEGDMLRDLFVGKESIFLRKAPVVAAMLNTLKKRKHTAFIFWQEIRDGVELKRNSPQLRLRNYIADKGLESRKHWKDVYCKCIIGWNAFVQNKTTDLKFYNRDKLPVVK